VKRILDSGTGNIGTPWFWALRCNEGVVTELSIKVAFCTQLHLTPESRLMLSGLRSEWPVLVTNQSSRGCRVWRQLRFEGGASRCSVTAAMTGTTIIGSETGICTASTIDGAGPPR
jgi:hypothetical protein